MTDWITKKDSNGNVKHIPIKREGAKIPEEHKEDLELKGLDSYIGSDRLYRLMGIKITEGIAYIMENGYSWFVTDTITEIRFNPKLKNEPFLSIDLKLGKNGTANLEISDGNGHIFYRKHYTYTDAKRNLKLFYDNGVLMLNSEY